jgi:purine-binding chemotaxis protein CheW
MIYPANGVQREHAHESDGYVSFRLLDQWLGVPVVKVQEVLVEQRVSPVPLAPPEIAGFLNLRGQIVTAIDVRTRLGLPPRAQAESSMNIVVRDGEELVSLVVDAVGDVVEASAGSREPTPRTLDDRWRSCCEGVVRLPVGLLVVMSVDELLRPGASAASRSPTLVPILPCTPTDQPSNEED